jgi:peptidyl-prolyl cis-trans isomerase B (cyclophilin B)
MRTKILALLLLALLVGVVAACGGDKKDKSANGDGAATSSTEAGSTSSSTTEPATTEKPEPATTATPEDQKLATECKTVGAPAPKPDGGSEPPKTKLDPAKTYYLFVMSNCGSFTITLDQKVSPKATASLVSLAREGFFYSTTFHRVVHGFVIQGGDPTGTGTGGPGYSTVDKPPADAAYTRGVVAMAKTGAEPPGTAGSQFFIVTGRDSGLPPDYALVGFVTRGIHTVLVIDALSTGSDGPPLKPVVIDKVTVNVKPG